MRPPSLLLLPLFICYLHVCASVRDCAHQFDWSSAHSLHWQRTKGVTTVVTRAYAGKEAREEHRGFKQVWGDDAYGFTEAWKSLNEFQQAWGGDAHGVKEAWEDFYGFRLWAVLNSPFDQTLLLDVDTELCHEFIGRCSLSLSLYPVCIFVISRPAYQLDYKHCVCMCVCVHMYLTRTWTRTLGAGSDHWGRSSSCAGSLHTPHHTYNYWQ